MRLILCDGNRKAQLRQVLLHTAAELLTVLQRARWVVSQHGQRCASRVVRTAVLTQTRAQRRDPIGQSLTEVFGQGTNALGLAGIRGIISQHVAIVFHHHTAA